LVLSQVLQNAPHFAVLAEVVRKLQFQNNSIETVATEINPITREAFPKLQFWESNLKFKGKSGPQPLFPRACPKIVRFQRTVK
jgi:hypothetical protein